VFFAPLKKAIVDPEGTLRLVWWEGNEKLRKDPLPIRLPPPAASGIAMLLDVFDTACPLVLEGKIRLPASPAEPPAGLYLEHAAGAGTAILVGPKGVTQFGAIQANGSGFKAADRVDRELPFGPTADFRLLMKHSLLEFYLNDHLIQCYSLPQAPTGHIGLIGVGNVVSSVEAWRSED
jgi:hypothetical protein